MKSNKIVVSMLIIIMIIIGLSTISNAALESKAGQNSWRGTANDQFTSIRAMEKSGGTLGQNSNLQATTYLDTTGNGIDVHMALATEWGGAALLAISDYGAFNTKGAVADAGTKVSATTGNITGVFQMAINQEYVSGLFKDGSNQYTSKIYSADERYYNLYKDNIMNYHKGDAMYQTQGWYNSSTTFNNPIIKRGHGIVGGSGDGYGNMGQGAYVYPRAVVVCGEGL